MSELLDLCHDLANSPVGLSISTFTWDASILQNYLKWSENIIQCHASRRAPTDQHQGLCFVQDHWLVEGRARSRTLAWANCTKQNCPLSRISLECHAVPGKKQMTMKGGLTGIPKMKMMIQNCCHLQAWPGKLWENWGGGKQQWGKCSKLLTCSMWMERKGLRPGV